MNKNPLFKSRKLLRSLRRKGTDSDSQYTIPVAAEIRQQLAKPADPKYEMSKNYNLKECYDMLSHADIHTYNNDEYTNMYDRNCKL